jgi:hypothetical protein
VGLLNRKGGSMKELYNTFSFFVACPAIFGSGYFVARRTLGQECEAQTGAAKSTLPKGPRRISGGTPEAH